MPSLIWRLRGMTSIDAPTEALENGWRSTTAGGDNLMLDFARAEAAAWVAIARAASGRTACIEHLGLHMSDTGSPTPFANVAHLTRPLRSDDAGEAAAALRDFFGAGAGGPFLVFSPSPALDLSTSGLEIVGHPPLMVRPAGAARAAAGDLRITEARSPAALTDFERTLVDAYPVPEMAPFGDHARLFGDALTGSAWHLFVGYLDGEPVATAGGFVSDHIVVVEAVSTRPEHRGRGFGAAITAAAMAAAPGLPAGLVSSDLGRGVYEGLGFLPLTRYTLWVGQR